MTVDSFSGNTLTFLVGNKQAFEISLADVAQTQLQGKNDVMLEFHVDDTTGANEVLSDSSYSLFCDVHCISHNTYRKLLCTSFIVDRD